MSRFCVSAVIASTALVLSFGAANAGPRHQHNQDVKAQCIRDAEAQNLTGHAYHVAVKQCRQNGVSTNSTQPRANQPSPYAIC
jgi:hypothetical protein